MTEREGSGTPPDQASSGSSAGSSPWKRGALDVLVGISLANLLLLGTWHHLLYTDSPSDLYHLAPDSGTYAVGLVNLVVVGALLGGAISGAARFVGPRLRVTVAYAAAAGVLYALGRVWMDRRVVEAGVVGLERGDLLVPGLAVAAGLLALIPLAYAWPGGFGRAVRGGLLILAPFALVHVAQLAPAAAGITERPALQTFEELPEGNDGSEGLESPYYERAVVVIFDELDGDSVETAVAGDPEGYPQLDRLRREAAYNPRVHTPGPHTLYSLPALSMGELLERSRPVGPAELEMVRYGASGPELWDGGHSVFAGLRERQARVALSGWYHPYCRVLRDVLDACHWSPWLQWIPDDTLGGWLRAAVVQWGGLLPYPELPAFQQNIRHIEEAGLRWAGDPRVDVVWIHHPLPHRPWLWKDEGWFGRRLAWRGGEGYRRNLREVDDFLGRLRGRLQESGLMERTALVVLSDHPQRYPANGVDLPPEGAGIPLAVDLPWDHRGVPIRSRCTPLYVGNLLHALFDGRLSDHEEVDQWIWEQGPPGCR